MSDFAEYVAAMSPEQKSEFERIRKLVHQVVPEAEETISYGLPTFKYKGTYLLYVGAFKNHMSLFPGSGIIYDLKADLAAYKISKGTIQFTPENPLPESVILELLSLRLQTINRR